MGPSITDDSFDMEPYANINMSGISGLDSEADCTVNGDTSGRITNGNGNTSSDVNGNPALDPSRRLYVLLTGGAGIIGYRRKAIHAWVTFCRFRHRDNLVWAERVQTQ